MFKRLLLLALTLWLVGCGSSDTVSGPTSSGSAPPAPTPFRFVLPGQEALARLPNGARLLAADAAMEGDRPPLLAGAVRVDVDEWTAFSERPGALTDLAGWNQRISAVGVTRDTPVIIYDNGLLKFASRVRWLLSHYGVRETYIVNGGAAALASLGAGTGLVFPSAYSSVIVEPPIPIIFKEQVAAALANPEFQILDVRSPAEFNGQLLLPGDARPGHIPGAINLPVERLFGVDGKFLNAPGLAAQFASVGLDPSKTLYVYCHDGAKSSLASSAAVEAGYPRVFLYYLSYRNWSEDPNLPVQL